MRAWTVPLGFAAGVALSACDSGNEARAASAPPPLPTTVNCADAPQLRQRSADGRRRLDELTSDQEKISVGNRARFQASLAIIADLKCKVSAAEADDALKPALEAARTAEASRSFYEGAVLWGEADFAATQVIALLIRQLPAPPPK